MAGIEYYQPEPRPCADMPTGWSMDDSFFDPAIHLQLEPPEFVKDLDFNKVPFPYSAEEASKKRGFSYSAPFRVLSDEGVRAARAAVDNNVAAYDDIVSTHAPAQPHAHHDCLASPPPPHLSNPERRSR